MHDETVDLDRHFFPYILKPARYLGGERGAIEPSADAGLRLLLVYPADYEKAAGDPDYQRLYVLLNRVPGLAVERAVLFAPDALARLAELRQVSFSLETRRPWTKFDALLFFIADPLDAAQIPRVVNGIRHAAGAIPRVIAVSSGHVIPRFLTQVCDDCVGDVSFAGLITALGQVLGFSVRDAVRSFLSHGVTPQLVPSTGTTHDALRIPLFHGPFGSPVEFPARSPLSIARDTLLGLAQTGFEELSFLAPAGRVYPGLPEVFAHVSLRENLARHHLHLPPLFPETFLEQWTGFRPHFLKSELPLIFPAGQRITDVESHPLAQAGQRALAIGWQTLVIVYPFDHWEAYREGLSSLVALADFLGQKAKLHEDRRLVRVRWVPARGTSWTGPLEYGERIQSALSSIHEGPVQRLPGGLEHDGFSPSDELARQLLLRLGPEHVPLLEELPPRFPELPDGMSLDVPAFIRAQAVARGLVIPEFGRPVDLSCSPFLRREFPPEYLPLECPPEPRDLPVVADVFGRRRRKVGFTRRLTPLPMRRLRVRYAKEHPVRFLSHLDIVRMIERAIRRSRVPVAYSEGFHPRPKISFGPPLPLGAISHAEYVDLLLDQDFEPGFVESLRQQFPAGLSLLHSQALPAKGISLFERINVLAYRVTMPGGFEDWEEKNRQFLSRDAVFAERAGDEGTRLVNIRPLVQKLEASDAGDKTVLEMELILSEKGTVRPVEVVAALDAGHLLDPRSLLFERTEVYIQEGARRFTPLETR